MQKNAINRFGEHVAAAVKTCLDNATASQVAACLRSQQEVGTLLRNSPSEVNKSLGDKILTFDESYYQQLVARQVAVMAE